MLTLEFSKHLYGVLGVSRVYVAENYKLFEWGAVQQICFTSAALQLMFEALEGDTAHLLQIERPATSRADLVEFDNEEIMVRAEASSRVKLCVEGDPSLAYGKKPRLPEHEEVGARKRKLSLSRAPIREKETKAVPRTTDGEKEEVQ